MEEGSLISAYFAIRFPSFTYYVKTLSCTIGRRPNPSSKADTVSVHVDIDLGPLKSVSRLHARIEYDEDFDGFVICVLGRNGAWVDGEWVKSGARVLLGPKTTIQIASRSFQFVVAPSTDPTSSTSPVPKSPPRSPSLEILSSSASIASMSPPPSPQPSKHLLPSKPTLTMAALCTEAISALGGKATLSQIRRWITVHYEWYKINEGWQVLVRQTLSANSAFIKASREKAQKTKDCFYTLKPTQIVASSDPVASERKKAQSRTDPPLLDPSTSVINVDGVIDDVIDVDGLDDVPPLQSNSVSKPMKPRTPKSGASVKKSKIVKRTEPTAKPSSPHGPITNPLSGASPKRSSAEKTGSSAREDLNDRIDEALKKRQSSASSSKAGPSSMQDRPTGVCLPIRIAAVPPVSQNSTGNLSSTQALQTEQPIVIKDGELILNEKIFSHLTARQLEHLGQLDTTDVLDILQGEVKRFFKEEYRAKKLKGDSLQRGGRPRTRGRGRGGASTLPRLPSTVYQTQVSGDVPPINGAVNQLSKGNVPAALASEPPSASIGQADTKPHMPLPTASSPYANISQNSTARYYLPHVVHPQAQPQPYPFTQYAYQKQHASYHPYYSHPQAYPSYPQQHQYAPSQTMLAPQASTSSQQPSATASSSHNPSLPMNPEPSLSVHSQGSLPKSRSTGPAKPQPTNGVTRKISEVDESSPTVNDAGQGVKRRKVEGAG